MNPLFPKINQVILLVIIAEFVAATADALIAPVYALFITQDVGAAVSVVGFSIAIYWTTKSILQLPVARYLDKNHGEVDDYYSMLCGFFVVVIATFLFYFSERIWHIYALQFLMGIGNAFVVPPFYAIFTRHLDKNSEGFEWSLRSSFSLGAGTAIGGAVSGLLGGVIGFRALFLINGLLMFIGWVVLFFLRPWILPRVTTPSSKAFIERANR